MLVPIAALIIVVGAFALAAIDEFIDSPPLAVVLHMGCGKTEPATVANY